MCPCRTANGCASLVRSDNDVKTAIVVGSGFEGLSAAYYLRDTYDLDVTLIDTAKNVGGVMRGFKGDQFHFDFGCQVFDNFDDRVSRAILALADNRCEFHDITYASRYAGKVATNVSVPDLTHLPSEIVERIEAEVQATGQDGLDARSLAQYYERRWGPTAAACLETINQKVLEAPASDLDLSSRIYAGLSRLRLFRDDAHALDLKQNDPLIDAKVAVPRGTFNFYKKSLEKIPFQNIVPVPNSFGEFCETVPSILQNIGVELLLETKISALAFEESKGKVTVTAQSATHEVSDLQSDMIVWCAPFEILCKLLSIETRTEDFISPIGTTITYYIAPKSAINPLGYLQNYDADMRFFRWSSMGLYSQQISNEGLSFCCTETPSENSLDKADSQTEALRDWEDLCALDLVSGQPSQSPIRRFVPNAIKRRRPGFNDAAGAAMGKLALQVGPSMIYQKPDAFGRTPTARTLFDEIDGVMS